MTAAATYEDLHSPQFHRNLSEFASEANIPVKYITQSAKGLVPDPVAGWLLNYHQRPSLMLNLHDTAWDENEVVFAMAGMLTRNLLLARVLSMPQFYEAIEAKTSSKATCLFLPGFHGNSMANLVDWKQAMILDALREREMLGKRTVLVVRNTANLKAAFGTALVEFLQSKFEVVKA